jgi:hypothetical protein
MIPILYAIQVFSRLIIKIREHYVYTIAAAACGLTIGWMRLKIFYSINRLAV